MSNDTSHAVWLAVYKRSLSRVSEPPIAWQVMNLPPGVRSAIFAPQDFQVCGRYSFEPENPRRPVHQTNMLTVPPAAAGAGFSIESISTPDRRHWAAVLRRTAKAAGWNQVSVVNRFPLGIWLHLRQDGRDVFPPRLLPPRAVSTEDLRSPFYLAALPSPGAPGDRLLSPEITSTGIAVQSGAGARVQGSPAEGFRIIIKTL